MAHTEEKILACSFCGKRENEARLIAGPGVCICSECVQTCCDLLMDDEQEVQMPDHLPTPMEMKQYMDSNLPLSLLEAARIDGCSEPQIFNRIVLPLMKPAIAVEAIFSFVSSWNNYFTPALILSTDKKKTLPILIAQLRSADWLKFDMGQVYAAIAFSIFPVIIVYLFLSKYIVGGVSAGAVKG